MRTVSLPQTPRQALVTCLLPRQQTEAWRGEHGVQSPGLDLDLGFKENAMLSRGCLLAAPPPSVLRMRKWTNGQSVK